MSRSSFFALWYTLLQSFPIFNITFMLFSSSVHCTLIMRSPIEQFYNLSTTEIVLVLIMMSEVMGSIKVFNLKKRLRLKV